MIVWYLHLHTGIPVYRQVVYFIISGAGIHSEYFDTGLTGHGKECSISQIIPDITEGSA